MAEEIQIVYRQGAGGPVVLLCMSDAELEELAHITDCIRSAVPAASFSLAVFRAEDWFGDFSPWPAPPAFEDRPFTGRGPETLARLCEALPALRSETGEVPLVLSGYSLAGLFALWSACERESFDGVICCSGSLWFPGWQDYADTHRMGRPCRVYLSLGGKESNTKHPLMSTVADCTRLQEKRLKADPMVPSSLLEWNSGGHFADAGKRIAKGVRWMIESLS